MIAFTIASRNYFAFVLTLYRSFAAHHPDVPFYAVLADEVDGFDLSAFPFDVIPASAIGVPDLTSMAKRYNITEFNTSLKPFVFLELFRRHPGESVLYLDPDMLVLGPFEELLQISRDGANCVLTPHIAEPAEYGGWTDHMALRYGIHNLGFCFLRDTAPVRLVVAWWARRLMSECTIDLERGLFVDQKWADLLPAFIDRTYILRDPGYNVAYWNLSQRRVRFSVGRWMANESQLRLVHFSGNMIEDPAVFSRHSTQFHPDNVASLRELLPYYRGEVFQNGHEYYRGIKYAYGWQGDLGDNQHTPERVGAERSKAPSSIPHLPSSSWRDGAEYLSWKVSNANVRRVRRETEHASIPGSFPFELEGYCIVCERESSFRVGATYAHESLPDGRKVPNWREHLDCRNCKLVTRLRGAYHVFQQECKPGPDSAIYLTEQLTPMYRALSSKFAGVVGSEYLGPAHRAGAIVDGVRHEDAQDLSFDAASFDFVLSFDVLEHVPEYALALREFCRVLRPGGTLVLTAPFRVSAPKHEVRAVLDRQGRTVHMLPPEFHGNPANKAAGSLAYRTFGWRLTHELRAAGFRDASVVTYWSERCRYFGNPGVVVLARKKSRREIAAGEVGPRPVFAS